MQRNVTSSRRVERDDRLDVLDVVHFSVALCASLRVDGQIEAARVVWNGVCLNDGTCLTVESRRHTEPHLGERYHGSGVEDTVAEEMVKLETDTVHVPEEAFLAVVQRVPFGGQHAEVLHVTPGQVRAE